MEARSQMMRSNLWRSGRRMASRLLSAPRTVRYAFVSVRAFHIGIFVFGIAALLFGFGFNEATPGMLIRLACASLIISVLSQIFVVNIIGHRFIGHANFAPSRLAQFLFLGWTVAVGLSSPLSSSLLHRRHHQNPDTDRDPHSPPNLGFLERVRFFARVYFNFFDEKNFRMREIIRESRRPFFIFLHRNGAYLSLGISLVLWLTLGLEGVLFIQTIPVLVCFIGQFNLVYQTHVPMQENPKQNRSVDSVIANILTLGEGAHESHHRAPREIFYPSNNPLMFDLTGFIIKTVWKQ